MRERHMVRHPKSVGRVAILSTLLAPRSTLHDRQGIFYNTCSLVRPAGQESALADPKVNADVHGQGRSRVVGTGNDENDKSQHLAMVFSPGDNDAINL